MPARGLTGKPKVKTSRKRLQGRLFFFGEVEKLKKKGKENQEGLGNAIAFDPEDRASGERVSVSERSFSRVRKKIFRNMPGESENNLFKPLSQQLSGRCEKKRRRKKTNPKEKKKS